MAAVAGACRLILLCNNISRVLDAVRSRTLPVRVAAPSETEICDLLQHVADKEKITLPAEFAARVGEASYAAALQTHRTSCLTRPRASATSSDRNMRRALLSLEACKVAECVLLCTATACLCGR